MSILHVAFYPSDWLAGTRGLSAEETGVYITLIARMYEMAGPIERDDNRLARLCGTKSKASFVKALDYLMSEGKVTETPDGLFNERVEKEIQNTTEKSSKAKAAAQSRWNKKGNKNNKGGNADAPRKHMPEPCQLEPEPDIEPSGSITPMTPKPEKVFLPEGWVPDSEGSEYARSLGLTESEIQEIANDFQIYWSERRDTKSKKTQRGWNQTWRNRCRDVAPSYRRNRQSSFSAGSGGYGQGGTIASIVAGRQSRD